MAITLPKVFIISAPSGAGKTTLVTAMLQRFDGFEFSISATTRAPRPGEQDGVHYYFLSPATFAAKRDAGEFLEWEEVYAGRFYGTLRSEVDRILGNGNYPIFDVDVEGGLNIKQQYGQAAVSIFIQPPSLAVLRERLIGRGTDAPEEVERRYRKAEHELAYAHRFDHIVVNDQLDVAIDTFCQLVKAHLSD
jgi:guanylate kinase